MISAGNMVIGSLWKRCHKRSTTQAMDETLRVRRMLYASSAYFSMVSLKFECCRQRPTTLLPFTQRQNSVRYHLFLQHVISSRFRSHRRIGIILTSCILGIAFIDLVGCIHFSGDHRRKHSRLIIFHGTGKFQTLEGMNKIVHKSSRRLYIKYWMKTATVAQLYDWMSLFLSNFSSTFFSQAKRLTRGKMLEFWNVGVCEYGWTVSRYCGLDLECCFGLP